MLFDTIEDAFENLLKDSEIKISKESLVRGSLPPDALTSKDLPLIALYDTDMSFVEHTVGSNLREERNESLETFSADGNQTTFRLSSKPLKPLVRIESPAGVTRREKVDFTVDYAEGEIRFNSPPEKGRKGVIARFFPLQNVTLISGMRVEAKYNFDLWGGTREECNNLAVDLIKTVLLGREKLSTQGLVVRPVSGSIIDGVNSKTFGRRIRFNVETDFYAETPVGAIERIEVQEKAIESGGMR